MWSHWRTNGKLQAKGADSVDSLSCIGKASPARGRFHSALRVRSLLIAVYSVAYAVVLLALGGTTFARLYSVSPYHRLQADAFLAGRLSLGDSIYQVEHDLAWHDDQVNQIWGLGVGIWLLPFECVWRLFGQSWFPDRIALGVAFSLLAWYAGTTGLKLLERGKSPTFGVGFVCLMVLCPAIWTLNGGPRLIYEETSLYACLVSLAILTAVVRLACFGRRTDYLICAALSAMSAIVRPTHGIYGLAGVLIGSIILLARNRILRTVLLGWVALAAGLLFLVLTNWARFGSPLEFGHRLTITPDVIVFMTRIDNPMRNASVIQAGKELFGALFLMGNLREAKNRDEPAIPWQAPHARWRDPYMSTYDLSWALASLAAVAGASFWIWQKRRGCHWTLRHYFQRRNGALTVAILGWAVLSGGALTCFFLFFPNFSARYLLDFAPAFTALALLLWAGVSQRWPWFGLIVLLSWLGYEIVSIQETRPPHTVLTREQIPMGLQQATGRKLGEFHGSYTLADHPAEAAVLYNGKGWNKETGEVGPILMLAVDVPEYIELLVSPRINTAGRPARKDVYRAKIDNRFLHLRQIRESNGKILVRFEVPDHIQRRGQDELLFLCFTTGYDKPDQASRRVLYSVRWR